MAKQPLPLLDRIKNDIAAEGGWVPEPFRLTDDITVPPISLEHIERLEELGDIKGSEQIVPVLKILLGDVYPEAMKVIPLALGRQVIEAILGEQLPDELVKQFLADIPEAE